MVDSTQTGLYIGNGNLQTGCGLANESVPVKLVLMLFWLLFWLVVCCYYYFYDYAAGLFLRMVYFVVDLEAIFC